MLEIRVMIINNYEDIYNIEINFRMGLNMIDDSRVILRYPDRNPSTGFIEKYDERTVKE